MSYLSKCIKKSCNVVACLSFLLIAAQQKQFKISWDKNQVIATEKGAFTVPGFSDKNFDYDFEKGILYTQTWNGNGYANEKSASLTNITYDVISENELLGFDKNLIPKSHNVFFRNSINKNKISYFLQINPIINDNGVFKKVKTFTLNYKLQPNAKLQSSKLGTNITNSVMANGEWYRFYIENSGVYQLTKSFLDGLGVNTNAVDPRTIKLFGNGGSMIPLLNSVEQPFDVTENAIKVVGENDGQFNNGDYILFYGQGPDQFNAESDTNINLYTDKTYYYINISPGNGKRIQPMLNITANSDVVFDTFDDTQYYEEDLVNIGKVGRRWFGDDFDIENERTYDFSFPNLVTSTPIDFRLFMGSNALNDTNMTVAINGEQVDNIEFRSVDGSQILVSPRSLNQSITVNSDDISVTLTYDNQGNPSANAFLDYIRIRAERQLRFEGNTLFFTNFDLSSTSGIAQFNIANASSISEIWDITNKYDVTTISNSSSDNVFSFKTTAGSQKQFVAFSQSNILTPLRDASSRVSNYNLKGTIFNNGDVDYIIITPNSLLSQAQRLAQINRNQYNINVKVVTLNDIYNEFSTGNPDIAAIRNFVKYVYDNATTNESRLKYLCLFGEATYDYKNRISSNNNLVPSWYSTNSYDLVSSFISDDFYGVMDINEGNLTANETLDIAIGRILVDNIQQAKDMVDKIEAYYSEESYGSWRNRVMIISDDIDWQSDSRGNLLNWERDIQETSESLALDLENEKPFINVIRVHSDSYQQESSSAGNRYPTVNNVIRDEIDAGALVINYFGHGGEDGIASERIFDAQDSRDVNNLCKFNLFVTVTCEYTKFDNPARPTAGEYNYWNKNSGSIGLITTTRQIQVRTGINFNRILDEYLFNFSSNPNGEGTMAQALQWSKNDLNSSQKRLAFFIGDPAMRLAIPKPDIQLTHINNVPISDTVEPLEALGQATIRGRIVDETGNFLSSYNGTLTATIFDKPTQRQTLANDGVYECTSPLAPGQGLQNCPGANRNLIKLDFKTLGETLFRGKASVTNGEFEFNFVVPRDIGIPLGNGKISFYAQNGSVLSDQTGSNANILIGGISDNPVTDNQGPNINLFMNDENFVSGGITNESPTLLVKLQDDNGINTASGIGHDITAILDGDTVNPIILNDFYEANVDDFTNGVVSYPYRDLAPGEHTLTIKAWDVVNNSSTAEIDFVVFDEDQGLVIENVLNFPNPFVNYTEFWFNHNSSEPLDILVQIFTVSGKLVRTLNGQTSGGKAVSTLSKDIVWDGRDDFGEKIGKGVYVYKLTVRSNLLNQQVEKIEKLVILQ